MALQGLEHEGGVYLNNMFGMRQERKEDGLEAEHRSDNFFWGEP